MARQTAPATDRLTDLGGGPIVILVRPQLGENIGTAARAMMNCGLTEMRLVAPRDDWPNPKAVAAASGADAIVGAATVFDTAADAVADLNRVYATTARRRDMFKEVVTPRTAAADIVQAAGAGERTGILFGPEAKGLNNDEVTLAGEIIEAPLNPHHTSLNLAQAVLLVGWEWRMAQVAAEGRVLPAGGAAGEAEAVPATRADLIRLFEHLEGELDEAGFLYPPDKRPVMVRNLRNMLHRAHLTEQEVRTLRGVVKALSEARKRRGPE